LFDEIISIVWWSIVRAAQAFQKKKALVQLANKRRRVLAGSLAKGSSYLLHTTLDDPIAVRAG